MSHFTVLTVLGTDVDPQDSAAVDEAVERILAPYDENMEVNPTNVFDHETILSYASYFENFKDIGGEQPVAPKHGEYPEADHEKVWSEYHDAQLKYGQAVFDKIGGVRFAELMTEEGENYGWDADTRQLYRVSTYNPDSKWDWYQVGGRWSGMFKPKAGATGSLGSSGVFGNVPETGNVDVIRVGDIDWEAMAREALLSRQELLAQYDAAQGTDKGAAWFYFDRSVDTTSDGWRERFLSKPPDLATYAWVNEEGWYQQGQMGWFGMGSNEESTETWNSKWLEAIKKLPPRTTVAVVDAHI